VDTATATLTFRQKGGTTRKLPATQRIIQLMLAAPNPENRLETYVTKYRGHETAHTAPHFWLRHLKQKLAAQGKLADTTISFHDLRRTLATNAYKLTKDIRLVQQLLGHRTLTATVAYLAPHDTSQLHPLLEDLKLPATWHN
jgi:integrase